jgi:hypothetical protein
VSVVALVIRQAIRMRRIVLPPVACLAVPVFTHYLTNGTIFATTTTTKVIEHKMYVFISSTTFV